MISESFAASFTEVGTESACGAHADGSLAVSGDLRSALAGYGDTSTIKLVLPPCPGPHVPHRCGRDCAGPAQKQSLDGTGGVVNVPSACLGRLIGACGSGARKLKAFTGCYIESEPGGTSDVARVLGGPLLSLLM